MPQNRRTDNRPDLYLFAKPPSCDEPRVAPSIRTWVSVFPNSVPPRHGMAKLATFSLASTTMQSGLGTYVRAHPTHSRPPIYVTAGWIIMCASVRSAVVVAHPPRFDLSYAVCGVKHSHLRIHVYAHARTHTRSRPFTFSHREEEEPPHKCQRPVAEHFLSSISVNKRCRVQWRRFESCWLWNKCPTRDPHNIRARARARVYDLSVFPEEGEGGKWLFATRELPPFAPRRRVSRRRWHFRYPSMDRSWFQTKYVNHTEVFI